MRQQDSNYVLARLANFSNAAEGPTLPPQLAKGQRVPSVDSPFVARTEAITGGTLFTLVFDEPLGNNLYAVYYKLESTTTTQISQYSGPQTSSSSPISIFVPSTSGRKITFYIQTQLSSGFSSEIETSPTCTSLTL